MRGLRLGWPRGGGAEPTCLLWSNQYVPGLWVDWKDSGRSRPGYLFVPAVLMPILALVGLLLPVAVASPALAGTGASDQMEWLSTTCPVPNEIAPVFQAMDGRVEACLRVADVPTGTYHIYLQDFVTGAAPSTPTTVGTGDPVSPVVRLVVSPATARPGQTVTVRGTLAKDYQSKESFLDFCWGRCPGGLQYQGVQVTWRTGTTFVAKLVLPAAPWLEEGHKIVSPVAGKYELGVQCVVQSRGCGDRGPEGEATVTLTQTARYTCATMPGCARLSAGPAKVSPGGVVTVTGYAPLENVIGAHDPFANSFTEERGAAPPPGVTFSGPDLHQVDIGGPEVTVMAAPTFSSLGRLAPLSVEQVAEQPISANPSAPGTVAWCGPYEVVVQGPHGTVKVPTKAAFLAMYATGKFQRAGNDVCQTVAVGANPSSGPGTGGAVPTVYAGFIMGPVNQDPMFATVAMYTTDGGSTWSPVPVPQGASVVSFGGFRYAADGDVEALFNRWSPPPLPASAAQVPLVERSTIGGRFSNGSLACPASGPCLTLGASVPGDDCAMGAQSDQPLLLSSNAGKSWARAGPPVSGGVPICFPAALVALSPSDEMVISSTGLAAASGELPALLTRDGGREWQVISLPALPANDQPELLALPDGAVLEGAFPTWLLLPAGGAAWCPVRSPVTAATMKNSDPQSYTVIGSQLWWLEFKAGQQGTQRIVGAEAADGTALSCAH